ncbi:MAG: MFS transporter [Methylobacterium sp.]|uniref:MFS transporter n=1 Tax=Methylobacterium sp. TaxID=409 RepID=UPI00258A871C|nr:MFS transporter [Methylobacterium sp.]MBY0294892.1 MFS transporter [Methylobacterium sp.]
MLHRRWLILAVLFAARTVIAYQFQSVAAASFALLQDGVLDFAGLGLLIGCHMLPGIALALPGGVLAHRFGGKPIVLAGLGLMALGGVMMTSVSTGALFAGRIVSGAGAALLNVVLTRMVTDWFVGREMVAAFGIFVASWPLGIAIALVTLPALALAQGWASVALASALASVAALILVQAFYTDPPTAAPIHAPRQTTIRATVPAREYGLAAGAGLIWGLYNVSLVIFVSAAPDIFLANGYRVDTAGLITSILGWVLVMVLPAGGLIAQRVGRPTAFSVASLVMIAGAALALALTSQTIASLLILAVIFGLPAGLLLSLPGELLSAEARSSGMGVFYLSFYLAMTGLPVVAGILREATDTPSSPILFGAGTALLAALGMLLIGRYRIRTTP